MYIAVAEGRIRLPYLNKLIGEIIVNRCFSDNGIASERFKETRSGLLRFLKERGMIGKSREDILYDSIVNRKLSVQEFISILQDFYNRRTVYPHAQ